MCGPTAPTLEVPVNARVTRNSLRMMIDTHFVQAGIDFEVAMEIDSLTAVCNIIRHEHWASILPRSAVPTRGTFGAPRILRLTDPSISRSLTVAHQPQREPSGAAQLLIEHLSRSLRNLMRGAGAPARKGDA